MIEGTANVGHVRVDYERQQAPEQPKGRADFAAVRSLFRRWAVEAAEGARRCRQQDRFSSSVVHDGTRMAKPPALRQMRLAHQVQIDLARRAAALVDGPDHQALPTTHVTRRKDARHAGGELAVVCLGIGTCVAFHA